MSGKWNHCNGRYCNSRTAQQEYGGDQEQRYQTGSISEKTVFAKGYRYRIADKTVPGHHDIFLRKYNTAIFVHDCFWHRHQNCKYAYMPKSRVEVWQKKFNDNVRRGKIVQDELQARNIKCLIVWECTIKKMIRDSTMQKELLAQIHSFIQDMHNTKFCLY